MNLLIWLAPQPQHYLTIALVAMFVILLTASFVRCRRQDREIDRLAELKRGNR